MTAFRAWRAPTACAFAEPPRVMDLTLSYRALAGGEVDVIAGDATGGLIPALDLVVLEDDRTYFPPYDAVPVATAAAIVREPRLRTSLGTLSGRISERRDARPQSRGGRGQARSRRGGARVPGRPGGCSTQ